ncbi:MAG: anthranilate phosphoribosyltransferase [Planctomycetota bacterium]|nr:MAG: anthranilate phosphoribosyltransferase [Planctomycetota bacterium]REJ92966.1 MAG: anthranilate phosphoribosyltransferase [Planctomycetota bacterium]REK30576.1 MAG: anthranilate phosphoribosyltransferase [Planctomycetota bacterium]REK46000.1 MAG: anthranilate phosphoribosyltransferase [Planctomycetota bacterium]
MTAEILGRLAAGDDLAGKEMSDAVTAIMQGSWSDQEIGLFLTALRAKGETAAEVAGAAAAMRGVMVPVRCQREGLLDTCGTGGDASGTFNISTAAAIVVAACGVPVAKHGNRSITSKTGSADVLEALGIDIDVEVEVVERCLDEVGIGFCFAPRMHPAMKYVAAVRKQLGFPTIFNLLGPLCNPAGAPYQLLGVGRPEIRETLAEALAILGTTRALIVCGADGLDEVTLTGPTNVLEVGQTQDASAGSAAAKSYPWTPADFDLPTSTLDSIRVENAAQSAAMIEQVLAGDSGTARDIVLANAAAAIWTAGRGETPRLAAQLAAEAIDSGTARRTLQQWIDVSRS